MMGRVLLLLFLSALGALSQAGAAWAQSPCQPSAPQLIIYHAGSLNAAFAAVEKLFTAQTGVCVTDVAAGSVDAARRITVGGEPCDIYASADFEDIELLLKTPRFASYDIRYAQGAMVLAYTTNSKNAATIAAAGGVFNPPTSVPAAAADWFTQLTQPGVAIAGSHPFLDPSGYRADMIFQLADINYGVKNLYDTFLQHYSISKATDALGKTFDYQFIYENNAFAAFNADATKTYRYVRLPDTVNLGNPNLNRFYSLATTTIPGLGVGAEKATVAIPATRVAWGLTILNGAPNQANAVKFLRLLFGSQGVALQKAAGPPPISPPLVSGDDFKRLPSALQLLVNVDDGRRQ
jgi:ABC-type molybdate transport system substrate-binding protein